MALDPKTSDPGALKTWNKMDFCHLFFCTFAIRLVNPIKVNYPFRFCYMGSLWE